MTTWTLKHLKNEQKGFTLIELLAVIVILGVIAAIAVTSIRGVITKSKGDADIATGRQIYEAARLYNTSENNGDNVTVLITLLQSTNYLDTDLILPSTKSPITGGLVTYTSGAFTSVTIISGSPSVTKTYSAAELKGTATAAPTPVTT
jgi:type IV pilus assembly protein PilA